MTEDVATADGSPIEVELKYRMTDIATGDRLIAADALAGFTAEGDARETITDDRYLDTIDRALTDAGYACRIRSSERGRLIALKGLRRLDDGGAIQRRVELEGPADPAVAPADWAASKARDMVVRIAGGEPLRELATRGRRRGALGR